VLNKLEKQYVSIPGITRIVWSFLNLPTTLFLHMIISANTAISNMRKCLWRYIPDFAVAVDKQKQYITQQICCKPRNLNTVGYLGLTG